MTRWNVLASALALALPLAAAAGEKTMPPQLARARYVAIGYDTGDGFLDARTAVGRTDLAPGDAEALEELRELVSGCDRFTLTERTDQADILIAVRTARRAVFEVGGRIGSDDARPARAHSPSLGGEVSSAGDVFAVYDATGARSSALWRERRSGGDFPRDAFEKFRKDVEKAAPRP